MYKRGNYHILLISIIAFILFIPFTTTPPNGKYLYAALFIFVIFGISMNIKFPKYSHWSLPALGSLTLVVNLININSPQWLLAEKFCSCAFFLYAIFLFGRNIFTTDERSADHIYGSICIYLLMGIVYATVLMIVQHIYPASFIYSHNGAPLKKPFDFYYLSFITLTTVGFGDSIARNDIGRAIIMIESFTGIFYLAVLVASLSNMFRTGTNKSS